ncbi:MAG: putative 5-nucleotidase [Blastococcus sp.]|nr:putative 5-nucleotidase [Blastococcus sp.]
MRRTRLAVAVALAASVVVGLPATASAVPKAPAPKADIPVQLLAMNDFHGRLSPGPSNDRDAQLTDPGPDATYGTSDDVVLTVGGSRYVAGTANVARKAFLDSGGTDQASLFVGAGDLVSASSFESSIFKDEPTIEVLDKMGLDVSAVGNHEFDRGTDELRRISAATDGAYSDDIGACDGVTPGTDGCFGQGAHAFDGADFPYLAANVISKETGEPMLPPYQVFDIGGGKKFGLIGVVTDTTPTIVAPAGIADVTFVDEAEAVNDWVPVLQGVGVEAIGVLVHEGGSNIGADSAGPDGCARLSGPVVGINNESSPAVDLIISAHSHQAYDCMLTDSAGQPRLVTQAGYYGRLLTDIRLVVDGRTGDVDRLCAAYRADNVVVDRKATDDGVASIVDYWNGRAAAVGNQPAGSTTAPIGGRSTRSVETSLGNLLAQSQLEGAQADPTLGDPVLAFMNPGGVRADLTEGQQTFRQLFNVQPFSNTVNAITLRGSDIRAILEQQFQEDQSRGTRLMLGTSDNLSYEYDLGRDYGDRVNPASIMLDADGSGPGAAAVVEADASYRVAANSFLIGGGDEFTAFRRGAGPVTGPLDVDTFVDYFTKHSPVSPPPANHSAGVTTSGWTVDPGDVESTPPTQPTTVDAMSGLSGPTAKGQDCDATAAISKAKPTRGASVTVTGTKFAPSQPVTATLASGRVLGTGTADGTGAVGIAFRVPADLPAGQQTVTLTSRSGEFASTSFMLGAVGSDVKAVFTKFVTQLLAWLRGGR